MTSSGTARPVDVVSPSKSRESAQRLLFIDNLRWSMILLVISMHAADTYSPLGSWYFTDRTPISRPTLLTFAAWQMFLQAFFMGLLFFVAGYFVPASFDKKGPAKFVRDRLFRLGLPVLFYMFVLGPVTEYFVAHSWTSTRPTSFANEWIKHIRNGEFLQENGPLWFCLALLIFSLIYVVWRSVFSTATVPRHPPGFWALAGFAATLALGSVSVWILHAPRFLNMNLQDFPQYVLMFITGIVAARGQWITKISYAAGLWWLAMALTAGMAVWLAIMEGGCAFCPGIRSAINWAIGFRCWEAFTCVAVSYGLIVLFREKFPTQGRLAKYLSDNAFSVYVFHPPIVIICARLMHPLLWHPLLKFGMLTVIAIVASFALSGAVFRRIPVLRAIL